MLAGRVLPPIHPRPPSPPLATFYNIPRRYARSNMQAIDNISSHPSTEVVKSARPLRKTNKTQERRSAPTSDPAQKADIELPSPALSNASLVHGKKRSAASLDDNGADAGDLSDPENSRGTGSASSSPGEHVCLCQPEPKIPRPRNGKSDVLFVPDGGYRSARMILRAGQRMHRFRLRT